MERIWIFNPDCELAVASGNCSYTPPANIVKMIADLAFLPAWMADEGDVIMDMSGRLLNPSGLYGGVLRLDCRPSAFHSGAEPCPWGWSPKMARWFTRKGMGGVWKPEMKGWASRMRAAEVLALIAGAHPAFDAGFIPAVCRTVGEVEGRLDGGGFVAKAPWSSSGKGLLFLEGCLSPQDRNWLGGMLRRQGYVMLERKLDRILDFAMEFNAEEGGISFLGWSVFQSGQRGEYRGNLLGSQDVLVASLVEYVPPEVLEVLKDSLPAALEQVLPDYRGMLGVDMMVYRSPEGKVRVQPCVEINLRCNMGIVALAFSRKYLAPGSRGVFSVQFSPEAGAAYAGHCRMQELHPAVYRNNRIVSGYLSLVPVTETTNFTASVLCY